MSSVRLGIDLSDRLKRAARAEGLSQSEFIRRAVARQCDEVLGQTLAECLRDVIGVVSSRGGRSDRTGDAYRAALRRRRA